MMSFLLVCLLFFLGGIFCSKRQVGAPAGTWMTEVDWEGGIPTCSSCPNGIFENTFGCSNGNDTWANGKKLFMDQTPNGARVVQFNVTLRIVAVCMVGQPAQNQVAVLIQSALVGFKHLETNSSCKCSNCMIEMHFVSNLQEDFGWPNFNYGELNEFYVIPELDVCISRAFINATYTFDPLLPIIETVEPNVGPTSGQTQIIVSGFNFYEGLICLIGEEEAIKTTVVDDKTIFCITPKNSPGGVIVNLAYLASSNKGEQPFDPLDAVFFFYYTDPNITGIVPNLGYQQGGTQVIIYGIGFVNTSLYMFCKFGDQPPVPAIYVNTTQVYCYSPPGIGTVGVSLTFNNYQYTNELWFEYSTSTGDKSNGNGNILERGKNWIIMTACILVVLGLMLGIYIWNRKAEKHVVVSFPSSNSINAYKTAEIQFKEIKLGQRIGRGSAGDVFVGIWCGTEVAVKVLSVQNNKLFDSNLLLEEAALMKSLRHPNVLQYLGACTQPDSICIITEYMPLGSLYTQLHNDEIAFPWSLIKQLCLDASRGLGYLHHFEPTIIHRDFKSHNLLLDSSWKLKVCDFGLSRFISIKSTMTSCGTPCWTAPEVIQKQHYTEKADIYSLSIVFWELITRESPYKGMEPFHVVFAVGMKGLRPIIPESCPPEFAQLMRDCWAENAESRPSVDKVLVRLQNMQLPEDKLTTTETKQNIINKYAQRFIPLHPET